VECYFHSKDTAGYFQVKENTIMRRIACVLLLLLALCGCAETAFNNIEICQEKCSLVEFYEENGVVHIICKVTLQNTTNEDVTVRISGVSQEDVTGGLLLNPSLSGMNVEDQSELFILKAGQYSEVLVDFCGEFAGTLQKQDRLVPDVIELEIVK